MSLIAADDVRKRQSEYHRLRRGRLTKEELESIYGKKKGCLASLVFAVGLITVYYLL